MAGKCIEGIEIPDKAPCPVCGAYEFQPCGLQIRRRASERAKKIADRAEKRRVIGYSSVAEKKP